MEQLKEHWRLECHLLQKKHQRDLQKLKIVQGDQNGLTSGGDATDIKDGKGGLVEMNPLEREKEVVKYFQERLAVYITQHLYLQSKCAALDAEVRICKMVQN